MESIETGGGSKNVSAVEEEEGLVKEGKPLGVGVGRETGRPNGGKSEF